METEEFENCIKESIGSNIATQENTINLLFHSPALNNKILVIVEGKDDKKVYDCHLPLENFYIYTYGTCNNYSELVEKLNRKHHKDFFAIKDADFDKLNNVENPFDNLFLTDTHDLETMLIKDNIDFKSKLQSEYNINTSEDFILKCVQHLSFLSYLKWYNNKHELKLSFKHISICNIFDGISFDKTKCIEELYKCPANKDIFSDEHKNSLTDFIEKNCKIDKWLLTNGHDLCDAIAQFIRSNGNTDTQISNKHISQLLRMNYTTENFHETNLYKNIQKWVYAHRNIKL